jgi:PPK2 family polyphosphate:nucleotide phosphotransferase
MAKISLDKIDTKAPSDFDKEKTKKKTEEVLKEMDDLQNLLYAENKHCLLIILQGMDASGKDSTIRRVFRPFNPLGISVYSFKEPTKEELSYDFLWRVHRHVPAQGSIVIFNRSHYENILITRVHGMCDDKTAKERMKVINDFEELLQVHNNTRILKFYLHISREEQNKRFQERLENPQKQWKFSEKDIEEAQYWDTYMKMYEDCFEHCNDIPWIIVPADQKWYKDYIIGTTIYETLKKLDMKYPTLKKK